MLNGRAPRRPKTASWFPALVHRAIPVQPLAQSHRRAFGAGYRAISRGLGAGLKPR
jgi:hypothetical protein